MAKTDLSKMDLNELQELQKDVAGTIAQFEQNRRQEARNALEAQAKEMGYTLAELTDGRSKRKSSAPQKPKYRHPENDAMIWSGRGRQPAWFKEAVETGTKPESMLID